MPLDLRLCGGGGKVPHLLWAMSKIEQTPCQDDEMLGCLHICPYLLPTKRCPMPDARPELLIVDDDVPTRTILSQVFSEIGYPVRTAQDGFSALFEIEKELPEILLSDLNMPGMPGFELLPIVRRCFPSIRVIAMSASYPGDCLPPGVVADKFHQKGASVESLIRSVEAMAKPAGSLPKRLSMDDLFGFPMYEAIPPRPSAEHWMRQVSRLRSANDVADEARVGI